MKKMQLLKERDFGAVIGDTFEFTFQNLWAYTKAFAIMVLPLALVLSIVLMLLFSRLGNMASGINGMPPFNSQKIILAIIAGLLFYALFMLAYILQSTMIYQYILLYEYSESPSDITLKEIWNKVKINFMAMLANYAWLTLLTIALCIISFLVISVLMAFSRIVGLMSIFIFIPVWIYLVIPITNFVIIRFREGGTLTETTIACFRLARGNWWKIFGVILVIAILAAIIQQILILPFTITTGVKAFPVLPSQPFDVKNMFTRAFGIAEGIAFILNIYLAVLGNFAICINYYSLAAKNERMREIVSNE